MAAARTSAVRKNIRLNQAQIALAQKDLGASTETETIVRALDLVISEAARNRRTAEANQRFFKSGIRIRDAFGSLSQ